tara:strand:- start:151 stop:495 length:345 start_codon:yes stop_codon:yes gene_type:complete
MSKLLNEYKKVSEDFWIRKKDTFEKIKGVKKVKLKGFEDFDFVLHRVNKKSLKFWQISEGTTGMKIPKFFKSPLKAIKYAESFLAEKGREVTELRIKERVGDSNLSPRYKFKNK